MAQTFTPKAMVIKREVADGIVRGLGEFFNCEEFQDFIVTVGKTDFGCHKLLLAACSGYFRGLLRSGMRETKQNIVTIDDISIKAFQLILEAIYTGRDILTNDNVIEVWKASNRLEIIFMVTECEKFVLKSLSVENHAEYFYYAKLLSTQTVTETIWNFILKHCDSFFNSSYFLEISYFDVLSLVKSQDLETSTEDEVLKAIFKWVEYNPDNDDFNNDGRDNCQKGSEESNLSKSSDVKGDENKNSSKSDEYTTKSQLQNDANYIGMFGACRKRVSFDTCVLCGETEKIEVAETVSDRKKYLFDLVSASRTYLVHQECLEMLLSHPLVIESKEIMDIFSKALMYQIDFDSRCGQWMSRAIHRNSSDHQNVAVRVRNTSVEVFSFSKHSWMKYRCDKFTSREISASRLVATNRSLVCLYVNDYEEEDEYNRSGGGLMYKRVLGDTMWSKPMLITHIPLHDRIFSVIAVDECIYVLRRLEFLKLTPESPSPQELPNLPEIPVDHPICHVMVYEQNILAFYSEYSQTAVLCFDTSNYKWKCRNYLEGPANGMTSFKDDHSTYLLLSNGAIWKLVKTQPNALNYEFIVKLWQCDWPLHGAIVFLDELYIYGIASKRIDNDPQLLKSFDGIFKKINYLQSGCSSIWDCTNYMFVPFIVNRKFIGSCVSF